MLSEPRTAHNGDGDTNSGTLNFGAERIIFEIDRLEHDGGIRIWSEARGYTPAALCWDILDNRRICWRISWISISSISLPSDMNPGDTSFPE